jgi:hypothetical protein
LAQWDGWPFLGRSWSRAGGLAWHAAEDLARHGSCACRAEPLHLHARRWLALALPGPKKHHREWLHLPELVMENIISFCDGPTLG